MSGDIGGRGSLASSRQAPGVWMAPHGDVPRPGSPQSNALCSRLNPGGRKPGQAGRAGHAQQVQEDVAPVSFPLKLPLSAKSREAAALNPPGPSAGWTGAPGLAICLLKP